MRTDQVFLEKTEIAERLDALAEMYAQRDLLNARKQEAINTLLTPEIKQ